jgi:hypothetical protein
MSKRDLEYSIVEETNMYLKELLDDDARGLKYLVKSVVERIIQRIIDESVCTQHSANTGVVITDISHTTSRKILIDKANVMAAHFVDAVIDANYKKLTDKKYVDEAKEIVFREYSDALNYELKHVARELARKHAREKGEKIVNSVINGCKDGE